MLPADSVFDEGDGMSKYDELLARADASHHILSRKLGAAIRELRAVEAEAKLLEVEVALHNAMSWVNLYHDAPADAMREQVRALAPERTVAGQEPSYHDEVIKAREQGYYRDTVAAPASPLLPGLERAAEICDPIQRRCEIAYKEGVPLERNHPQVFGEAEGARVCKEAIRAEISRLKGEGSES